MDWQSGLSTNPSGKIPTTNPPLFSNSFPYRYARWGIPLIGVFSRVSGVTCETKAHIVDQKSSPRTFHKRTVSVCVSSKSYSFMKFVQTCTLYRGLPNSFRTTPTSKQRVRQRRIGHSLVTSPRAPPRERVGSGDETTRPSPSLASRTHFRKTHFLSSGSGSGLRD